MVNIHNEKYLLSPDFILSGHFTMVHERFADDDQLMETQKTVLEWKNQLLGNLKVFFS